LQNKRLVLLMGLLLSIFMALLGRIFYYQVIKGAEISRQAAAMRSQKIELREFNRGDILDRNLFSLTSTRTSPALYIATSLINRPANMNLNNDESASPTVNDQVYSDWAQYLAQILINKDERAILKDIKAITPGAQFIRLHTNLSPLEIERINASQKFGLIVAPFINRYQEDGFCAHLLGYVSQGEDGQGQSGLERTYNAILQSSTSSQELVSVVDARGQPIQGLVPKLRNQPKSNGTVVLTIDKRIQEVVEKAMDQRVEKGAAVVMDIHTKEILAMVSRPTFNPYQINDIIAFDNRSTLTNRALSKYNPGSIFKILLSLAALEEGQVSMDEKFNCSGKYRFNDQVTTACWKEEGHGTLTLAQAFANSCNPTFIQIGLRLGRTQVLKYVDKLHITDETIIGYSPGNMGTYVRIEGGEPALGNASLGQKGVMISPLQIASLLATVASDGTWASPSLVRYTVDQTGHKNVLVNDEREQVISSATAGKVRQLLEKVVEEGTGKAAAIPEVRVAGKTATSQTGRMKSADEEILNTWFAGYLPADEPRWAIVVMAEEGSSGAQTCAPIFRDISRGILEYY